MARKNLVPTRLPTHPGAILREDVLPALDMSISDVARALGISRQQLQRILAETAPITPQMALRIGKFCGNGPEVWLRMQVTCDLWHARHDMAGKLDCIPTVKANAA
jgi:antitoxin HigA-1